MTDLITKLEEAGEGSRELDKAVWLACGLPPKWGGPFDGAGNGVWEGPHVSYSLDAALALTLRVLPGWHVTTSTHRCLLCEFGGNHADLRPANATVSKQMDDLGNYDGKTAAHAHASTPALALCAAILRASEEKQS